MPRMRKLTVGALNIKTHPHSPERYVELFRDVQKISNSVKIRGTDWGTIGWINEIDSNRPLDGLYGEFYRFLNINPTDPWFDQRHRQIIEIDEEVDSPPVPEHLKPNLKQIRFVFYPEQHRLFFDAQGFAPSSAQKLLLGIFRDVEDKYGFVDVIVESSREAIEKILSIPSKTRLEIRISLPNPDDTSEEEQRVLDRLREQHANTVEEIYTGDKGEGLSPDENTKTLMRVAQSNGYVKATGYDGEERIEYSTIDHPLKESEFYNPEITSRRDALLSLSTRLLASIMRR